MKVYLCDWCGKAYKPGPVTAYRGSLAATLKIKPDSKHIEAPIGTEVVHMSWTTCEGTWSNVQALGGITNDICPDCANALREFIKSRRGKI